MQHFLKMLTFYSFEHKKKKKEIYRPTDFVGWRSLVCFVFQFLKLKPASLPTRLPPLILVFFFFFFFFNETVFGFNLNMLKLCPPPLLLFLMLFHLLFLFVLLLLLLLIFKSSLIHIWALRCINPKSTCFFFFLCDFIVAVVAVYHIMR